MQKAYSPSLECEQYKKWEASGAMEADSASKKDSFVIMLPPPNVTGKLHLGHAAMLAIEDIMIRFASMNGKEVLWLPGTDHAAIATENVVLKHLGLKSREKMKREDFMDACREFKASCHATITNQMKKMGAWLDWSREAYTFDDKRGKAVNDIFKMLWKDGLIERGHRLINWSVGAGSVLSDDELEWEERTEPFYNIQCGPFVIGTVRPETKCADSAVVVHPEDERYKQYIGTEFEYETYAGKRKFHVIADEVVDPEFGTGCMTISPAHDANDYALAMKHGLPLIQKIDFDGKMTAVAGECEGLSVMQARKKSVEIMKAKGLIVEEKPYLHRVPLCYRTGTVVEPMLSTQWFIRVEKEFTDRFTGEKTTLKKLTQDAVRENYVKIIPERFNKTYFQWIDNLRDWCISRQIWWGHRIPVWYDAEGNMYPEAGEGRTQDPDTLDTWFSSALWPFSTLGWEDNDEKNAQNADLQKFFPGSVLETGHDILFFWVARMIMFSRYATGKYPFHTVYLHGLVTDAKGKKMSKSKGNGIDPIDVIDEFGADAVRLSLVIGTTPGNKIPIGAEKIKGYRNFVNKLWNAGRFVQYQLEKQGKLDVEPHLEPKNLADAWILSVFGKAVESIREMLGKYHISAAGNEMYHFIWDEFCDWYIEASKKDVDAGFLKGIMLEILKLVHPLTPFVSEAVWKELTGEETTLCKEVFPEKMYEDGAKVALFEEMKAIVTHVRTLRAEHGLKNEVLPVSLGITEENPLLQEKSVLEMLGRVEIHTHTAGNSPDNAVLQLISGMEVAVIIPKDEKKEAARLEKEKKTLEKQISALKGRLANKKYTEKAPAELVEQTRAQLAEAEAKYANLG